ncbi:MAG: type II toxin-antitoxin system prevent-host-death family antitoxin [Terracidiphilus sp.]|jgi:predicted nucleic acid-binding protein
MSEDRPRAQAKISAAKAHLSRLVAMAEAGEEIVITRAGKSVARLGPTPRLPRTFLDTNVLVYCDDETEPVKQQRALEVLDEHTRSRTGVISLQVLQEYFVTASRKLGLDTGTARRKVEIFAMLNVAEPTVSDILAAIDLHMLHGFSYWDALVLRMAKQSGCRVILSEDMQHGRIVDGVEIVNPFL